MKKAVLVLIILLVCVLLIPIKVQYKDGGTTSFHSLSYEIIQYHKLVDGKAPNQYEVGSGVKVFGFEIYKNTSLVVEEKEQ